MRDLLNTLKAGFLTLLFPQNCILCGRFAGVDAQLPLCRNCMSKVKTLPAAVCDKCGRPAGVIVCPDCRKYKPHFDKVRAGALYEGAIKEIVHNFKYKGEFYLARYLASLMMVASPAEFLQVDCFVPVPLDRSRQIERGYNQAMLLAQEMRRRTGVPVKNVLVKARRTEPQTALSGEVRRKNLKGAFKVKGRIEGIKSVVLVDDVITTGATLSECARTLKQAGVEKVFALVAARAL